MIIDWTSLRKKYNRPDKNLFPVGSRVYIGRQGKGKTLSMVWYTHRMLTLYPKAKLFSNVLLYGIPYKHIDTDDDLATALEYQNGADGVLVLLDEAHLTFNTRTGIPLDVLTAISQQRKDRRRLVFSSQIWNELDISVRKQVQEVVNCKNVGRFQYNSVYDGETVQIDKSDYSYSMDRIWRLTEIFKHNQEYYDRYDTYQKIIRNDAYSRDGASSLLEAANAHALGQARATKKIRRK